MADDLDFILTKLLEEYVELVRNLTRKKSLPIEFERNYMYWKTRAESYQSEKNGVHPLLLSVMILIKEIYGYKHIEFELNIGELRPCVRFDRIIFATCVYDIECLYQRLCTNPSVIVKNIITLHKKYKKVLDTSELSKVYDLNDLKHRNEKDIFDLTETMKTITSDYIGSCIAMSGLKLPHYIVLWILDWVCDNDENYSTTGTEFPALTDPFLFKGFDILRSPHKIALFDMLTQLQKIRIIEDLQRSIIPDSQ
jgi:hypothetical protein